MLIEDFYVIPENDIDEHFITDELSFLIDISIKRRQQIGTIDNYKKLVQNQYNTWANRAISYG